MGTGETIAAYRLFDTTVVRTALTTHSFVRVTVTGAQLHWFAPYGLDQRIKLILPGPNGYPGPLAGNVDGWTVPVWRHALAQLGAAGGNVLRTYTPSGVRPESAEVDIDFFVHGSPGPASEWALRARPGDRLLVSGPDVRAGDREHGIQWRPGDASSMVLLAGDEAAVPAMSRILASLAPGTPGVVLVEAHESSTIPAVSSPGAAVDVRVLRRSGGEPGAMLLAEIAAWRRISGVAAAGFGDAFYAWIAAESRSIAPLRRAVASAGITPWRVQAQGYWREGGRNSDPKTE